MAEGEQTLGWDGAAKRVPGTPVYRQRRWLGAAGGWAAVGQFHCSRVLAVSVRMALLLQKGSLFAKMGISVTININ